MLARSAHLWSFLTSNLVSLEHRLTQKLPPVKRQGVRN
jgi:hypothetical protein